MPTDTIQSERDYRAAMHAMLRELVAPGVADLVAKTGIDLSPSLSELEASEFLGIRYDVLQQHRRRGTGPTYLNLGKKLVRYRLADLDAWRRQHRIDTGATASGTTEGTDNA